MTYTELSQAELDAIYAHTRELSAALKSKLRAAGFKRDRNLWRRGDITVGGILGHPSGIRASANLTGCVLTSLYEVERWVDCLG